MGGEIKQRPVIGGSFSKLSVSSPPPLPKRRFGMLPSLAFFFWLSFYTPSTGEGGGAANSRLYINLLPPKGRGETL